MQKQITEHPTGETPIIQWHIPMGYGKSRWLLWRQIVSSIKTWAITIHYRCYHYSAHLNTKVLCCSNTGLVLINNTRMSCFSSYEIISSCSYKSRYHSVCLHHKDAILNLKPQVSGRLIAYRHTLASTKKWAARNTAILCGPIKTSKPA